MASGGIVKKIINTVTKTLFPLRCSGCGTEGSFLCYACITKLERYNARSITSNLKIISIYKYQNPLDKLIISGKYNFYPKVFTFLSYLIANKLPVSELHNVILSPIPLSNSRLRWRGFNQSEVICKGLSKQLKIPWKQLLIRTKNTKTQKDLSKNQRRINVQNAFRVTQPIKTGKTIVLIDDVVTTGATLQSAAQTLIATGAKKVFAITIAAD